MRKVHENHQREQYFWDPKTVQELTDFLEGFENPCCLCTPSVGEELHRRGKDVTVLDVDERFAHLPQYQHWDLYRPTALNLDFDVILVDPPFFKVSLSQLFKAVRMLCRFDLSSKIVVTWLTRRESALLGTFAPFGLSPMGYHPGYLTVQSCAKNDIQLYANWDGTITSVTNEIRE
jgi:hypothetical protein